MKTYDVTALGELLIDFTESSGGKSRRSTMQCIIYAVKAWA